MDPIQQKVVNAETLVMDCQSTEILGHASATALTLLRTGPEMINNINETPITSMKPLLSPILNRNTMIDSQDLEI